MRWVLLFVAVTANAFGQVAPKRVATDEALQRLVSAAPPAYPASARQTRITGVVILEITIDTKGKAQIVRLISGHPLLEGAATTSVRSSQYRPFVENGNPITVITAVMVSFAAADSQVAAAEKELAFQYNFWTAEGVARQALTKNDPASAGTPLKKAGELLAAAGRPGHCVEQSQFDIDSRNLSNALQK